MVPIIYENDDKEKKSSGIGLNLSFFTNTDSSKLTLGSESEIKLDTATTTSSSGKKRGRKPKVMSDGNSVVTVDDDGDLPKYQTNEPYSTSYNETDQMLRESISQINSLSMDLKEELDTVRSSKTLKGKYTYISDLAATSGTLLSTKIAAIREMNSSITNAHKLDMQRLKDLKMMNNQDNDDKKIIDLYNAFINTPTSTGMGGPTMLGPTMAQAMTPIADGFNSNIVRVDPSNGASSDISDYMANLTPEQKRMVMCENPNIAEVVVYNKDTGNMEFDVVDRTTGQSIPNYAKPDPFLLEGMSIDLKSGIARNANIDKTYDIIVVGSNGGYSDY